MIKFRWDKQDKTLSAVCGKYLVDWFWVNFGLSGLHCEIEFPSDWHEERQLWITIGIGFMRGGLALPWYKRYADHHQCSGPTFGFKFFSDILWIHYGNSTGSSQSDPTISIYMPWHWKFVEHLILSGKETHEYRYILKSGEVQNRTATINVESREWKRAFWWPRRLYRKSIGVWFSDEVGERSGSWKGGTLGCGYDLKDGETPLVCLRRMEMERKF